MHHCKIKFFKNPTIWLKDKWQVGLNQTNMFLLALIPGLFGLFGFVSNIITIARLDPKNLNIILLWFLFIYGLFISLLIFSHQRVNFRMNRDRGIFKVIHRNIAEKIREYLAVKRSHEISPEYIQGFIKEILNSFNDNFLKVMHRHSVSISVKYLVDGSLYPIRIGSDSPERDNSPEHSNNSPVYKALNKTGKKKGYIYVKDIDHPDNYELRTLGDEVDELRARSKNKYDTFIALPIRSGELSTLDDTKIKMRKDLGIIGFDLKNKFGFGNFDEYEFDILATLADLLSEPVHDLIEKTGK